MERLPNQDRECNESPARGKVLGNTYCSNPTDGFGAAFGYTGGPAEEEAPIPSAEAPTVRTVDHLTDFCAMTSILEGFVGGKVTGGFRNYLPAIPVEREINPQLIGWGVDTLITSVYIQVCATILEKLETLKQEAQDRRGRISSGPFRFEMESYGLAPHWRYVLKSSAITVKIRGRGSYDLNAQVDFRSAFLWSVGVDGAVHLVREFLQRLALQDSGKLKGIGVPVSERSVRLDVSRIDLAADFEGIAFDGSELSDGRFITRARRKTVYSVAGVDEEEPAVERWHIDAAIARLKKAKEGQNLARLRKDLMSSLGLAPMSAGERMTEHVRGASYWSGATPTGYSFGAGHLAARIYRKDIEAKATGKLWFRDIWERRGYTRTADGWPAVWRVEFQIRSEGLKTFYGQNGPLRSWTDTRKALGSLWAQLTAKKNEAGKCKGWLSLRDIGSDKKRERWPISLEWLIVQSVRWSEPISLVRISRGQVDKTGPGKRIRTPVDQMRAWCAGAAVGRATGQHAAERLGPQLAGLAVALTAARQVSQQTADPATEAQSRRRIMRAVSEALDAKGETVSDVCDAADRMVVRANWRERWR